MIIITWARLQRATVKLDTVNQVRFLYVQLQGLGSSQLADHLVNEMTQGPANVQKPNMVYGVRIAFGLSEPSPGYYLLL